MYKDIFKGEFKRHFMVFLLSLIAGYISKLRDDEYIRDLERKNSMNNNTSESHDFEDFSNFQN